MNIFDNIKKGLYYILEGTGLSATFLGVSSFIENENKKDIENPPEYVSSVRESVNKIIEFPEKIFKSISSNIKTFLIIAGLLALGYIGFKTFIRK